jgi:hypothetical protein
MLPPATLLASSAFQRFAVSATLRKRYVFMFSLSFYDMLRKKTAAVVEKFWLTGKKCIRFAGPPSEYSLKNLRQTYAWASFFAFHYLLYELLFFGYRYLPAP